MLALTDKKGRIYGHPDLVPVGMEAGHLFALQSAELIRLPAGSQLFTMPARQAIGYSPSTRRYIALDGSLAVAAFAAPGYTATYSCAYKEIGRPRMLPL